MYLKKLEIQGFKSFAEKIVLDFNSGITAVVGPNGSGKSNIADAVRWVLGEQSAKNLRGSKMEDVIFSGTEYRKPVGFAEVSLTVDNSDRALPLDFSEVTVTRRVFRSGESEYLINKTSCRLKDINELFLDTGIGKDGYSIIGQGRVDEILSSRSEDRRHIFEEASGIMKYKVRKQETEKKLELTRQNLIRINDIINELQTQIEPLKEQSEAARKFLALRESLKELEVNLYIENISKMREKIKEYEEQYTSVRENIELENRKLEGINESNKSKSGILHSMEDKINSAREKFYSLEGALERCNSDIKINEEKISNLNENSDRINGEISEINTKLEQLKKEEGTKDQRMKYLNDRLADYSAKLEENEKKMEAILAELDESERNIENLKSGIMDKLDLLSDKKTQVNNVRHHQENLKKRQSSIKGEIEQLLLDNDKENIKLEDLSDSILKAKNAVEKSNKLIFSLNEKKTEFEKKLDAFRRRQSELRAEIHAKTSRLSMLQDMEKNLEGYNRSVKVILQACQRSPEFGRGIHGALAQLITVDKRYEAAIEMTLGGALQNIVTSTEEDAKKAIEFLKRDKLGRAAFLPISSVNGKYFDENTARQLNSFEGFCGVASDLVSVDSQYRGIILSFLGKVAVVENLDSGIKIARKFGYSFRIVTLEGDVISTSGSMAGGSIENRGPGILSRHREITEIQENLERDKKSDRALERESAELVTDLVRLNGDLSQEETTHKNNELIKLRDESHLAQVQENLKRISAKIEMLQNEKNQLVRNESDTEEEYRKYAEEVEKIEQDITDTKSIIAEHQEKHKDGQSVRDALHNDITDYKISVNSILESIEGVKETVERLKSEKENSVKNISRKNAEIERFKKEVKSYEEQNEGLKQTIKGIEEEKAGKTFEIDSLSEERKVIEEELSDIVNKINEINRNIVLLQEDFNRIDVRKAKSEAEMEAVQNRMWDEYELTYSNALELKKDIGSLAQAQKRINELRNGIRELGPVNVSAIDEYVKTKERFEFMTLQRDDMEKAEEKLKRVIYEMTSIMKNLFLEQFKLINDNFNIVFKELFEGGRASLVLTDAENVLESGIEIEVQPPGKKLQNMMLLSGGERAFTAIALLFSILRLKPAPFCLLDEIEAALDDANVYRFAEYIKRFSVETQFVMVTHRKGTMESSDTLYGVTMQEHGVSKVVSMKMGDKAS